MWREFLQFVADRRPAREIRGLEQKPYLIRHFLLKIGGRPLYLHKFVGSDPGAGLHSHPASSIALPIAGGYDEIVLTRIGGEGVQTRTIRRRAFRLNFIPTTKFHRVVHTDDRPVWTLFLAGPRTERWGFLYSLGRATPQSDVGRLSYLEMPQSNSGEAGDGEFWEQPGCILGRDAEFAEII